MTITPTRALSLPSAQTITLASALPLSSAVTIIPTRANSHECSVSDTELFWSADADYLQECWEGSCEDAFGGVC
eukprot:m.254704 g.254704  ORF g.254704 m.254704 type:complete len:74 (+) comp54538_c0_seq11:2098-2319(+)